MRIDRDVPSQLLPCLRTVLELFFGMCFSFRIGAGPLLRFLPSCCFSFPFLSAVTAELIERRDLTRGAICGVALAHSFRGNAMACVSSPVNASFVPLGRQICIFFRLFLKKVFVRCPLQRKASTVYFFVPIFDIDFIAYGGLCHLHFCVCGCITTHRLWLKSEALPCALSLMSSMKIILSLGSSVLAIDLSISSSLLHSHPCTQQSKRS